MNCCVVNKETEKYGENSYCSQFCTNSLFTAIAVLCHNYVISRRKQYCRETTSLVDSAE